MNVMVQRIDGICVLLIYLHLRHLHCHDCGQTKLSQRRTYSRMVLSQKYREPSSIIQIVLCSRPYSCYVNPLTVCCRATWTTFANGWGKTSSDQ